MEFNIHPSLAHNNVNDIQKQFHFDNICNISYEKHNGISILSYNVHAFINPNNLVSVNQNITNILNLIKIIDASIIFLQEISFDYISQKQFLAHMFQIGYNYYIFANNGHDTLFVGFFTKIKYYHKIVDLTVYKYPRKCIILFASNYVIAGVHLEIGSRNKLEKINNYQLRLKQLSLLLKHNPDMIIGDFNFVIDKSYEADYLLKYYKTINSDKKSTPFNRVDHVFIKNRILINKYETLKCNYSDHLPILVNFTVS